MTKNAIDLESVAGQGVGDRLARLGSRQRRLLEQRLQAERVSGHLLVARALARLGITHVYGVPGQPVYDTFPACARQGLRLIGTHHQQSAALMASAHNYFAGRPTAVTLASTGVPAANALGAAVVARDNGWPLVVIAGAAPLTAAGAGYFMALDACDVFRSVAKSVVRVQRTGDIAGCIAQAFDTAMRGRPGAVLVELPEDILAGTTHDDEAAGMPRKEHAAPDIDGAVLRQVTNALVAARRPLLVAGQELRWGFPYPQLRALVDRLEIPFVTSPNGRGALPDDHPLCLNAAPWAAQAQADLVLLLGARLNWEFRYGQQIAADAKIIQVDVQPEELSRSRTASVVVHADAAGFLRALIAHVDPRSEGDARTHRDRIWLGELRRLCQHTEAKRETLAGTAGPRISPLRLAAEVRDALPADAITIFDGNVTLAACQRMIPARLPVSRLTPGTSGCVGVGIPYAIAARLANPGRPVATICGDYAFGLSAMELETAARHDVPIVVVVANNDGNGGSLRHRMHMRDACAEPITMYQSGLRYDRLAAALGAHTEHVECADAIGPAVVRALESRRPACINVAIDPDAPYPFD